MEFKVLSSWIRLDNTFPHRFILELDHSQENQSLGYDIRFFKRYKKQFMEYMKENYGTESKDWMIAKHRGPFNFGASIMVGFRHNNDAAAFIIENT